MRARSPHSSVVPRSRGHAAFFTIALSLAFAPGCASCTNTGQGMLGIMGGVVNDPSNLSLRRAILSMGLSEFCKQMTTHNAPLKLTDDTPVIGRFYPTTCNQQTLQDGSLFVQFSGFGYAYTNVSKRLTFSSNGAVEYNQDFQMSGSDMYVYFRPRRIAASNFQTHIVEQPVASFLNSLSSIGDTFGKQLVSGQLGQGFTVIRESSGSADFALGVVEVGKRPVHPFDVHGADRITYENLRTEVHQNERDFVGPIEVTDSGRALYISAQMDGIQAIDLLVMDKNPAEASLHYYYDYAAAGPLAGAPRVSDIVQAGVPFQHTIAVPPGIYYIVLDNTPTAGTVAPPMNVLDDRAATVSYVVQIGDAP